LETQHKSHTLTHLQTAYESHKTRILAHAQTLQARLPLFEELLRRIKLEEENVSRVKRDMEEMLVRSLRGSEEALGEQWREKAGMLEGMCIN
jgi:hypothetical protein